MFLSYSQEELDETNSASSPSSSVSREPVRGHISSLRASSNEQPKEIKTTLKDANQKHFDPRTGVVQNGPSEMGTAQFGQRQKSDSPSSMASNLSTMMNNDSLAGSLVTLGSRSDLISSSLEIYNSTNNDLSRLSNSYDQLSDVDDSLMHLQPTGAAKNTIGVGTTRPSVGNKSILQRTKSDSVKTALFASTPTLDNSNQWNSAKPSPLQPQMSNGNNKTVTFSGLATSFQNIAPILMPGNIVSPAVDNQNQFMQNQNLNQNKNKSIFYDSQIKDSAYGSTENNEFPWNNSMNTPMTMNGSKGLNGTMTSIQNGQKPTNPPLSTVRTQNSQQQRTYTGSLTTSMKDTAYDRINPNNFKKRR